jgi:glycosyltransferase involved in cell wall biosynthesis
LTPWAFHYKWWKKWPAWWLYQRHDLSKAEMIHVTAESEIVDVRRLGFTNEVVIAPLGVHIVTPPGMFKTRNVRTITYIGRIAPIKGLPNLFRAFSEAKITSGWRIVIVGPDQEGHTTELKNLTKELGLCSLVDFAGPRYDADLSQIFDSTDIFVLPSYSENFGSVVIEAMAHGLPVITTKGTPWKELEENKCGWWVDVGVKPLARALRDATSLSSAQLREMGNRGRDLVSRRYSWERVSGIIEDVYVSLTTKQRICYE